MRLFTVLAAGMTAMLGTGWSNAGELPLKTFAAAIAAAKWNPTEPGSFCFVQATDLHVNDTGPLKMERKRKYEGRNFVDDINRLEPKPKFLIVTGDTVSDTFRDPSSWANAEKGFQNAKDLIFSRLAIPYHIILGNNDCSPEAFHKVWPDAPMHWSFDCEGIHFIGLYGYNIWKPENSNHAGILLDKKQLDWLESDVAAAAKHKTVVLFTHEPLQDPDCHLIRGQLAPMIEGFEGEVWNIAGHNHMNCANSFMLGGKLVRALQTITPVGSWRPSKGAYRIILVREGKIVASVLRWITKDGEPLYFESDTRPENLPLTQTNSNVFGKNLLLKVDVGSEDKPLRIESERVEDRISNLRIRKGGSTAYKIPLGVVKGEVQEIALLAAVDTTDAVIELSQDGRKWMPAGKANVKKAGAAGTILSFDFTPEPDAVNVYVKIKTRDKEAKLYGIALLRKL